MQVAQLGNASGTLHRKIPLPAAARQAWPWKRKPACQGRARAGWRLADAHRGREQARRWRRRAWAPTRALPWAETGVGETLMPPSGAGAADSCRA